jgi:hypothetical protein
MVEWFEDARKGYKIGRERLKCWRFLDQGFAYIRS